MDKMSISSARHLTCQIRSLDFGNDISRGKFVHRISGDDISQGKYVRRIFGNDISQRKFVHRIFGYDISRGKYVRRIFGNDISRVILSEAIYETWNFSSLVELSPLG